MAMKCRCTQRYTDKQGRIIGYILEDSLGGQMRVNGQMLRSLILNSYIEVTNLKLTADNRIIVVNPVAEKTETTEENKDNIINKLDIKDDYFNKFLRIIEYINKATETINKTSGYYARGTEYGLRNRVYDINIYEPGGALLSIPGDVIYESAKYGGMVKLSLTNQYISISVHGPHSNGYFNCSMAALINYFGLTANEEKNLREMFELTLEGGDKDKRHLFSDRDIIINTFKEFLDNQTTVQLRLKSVLSKYSGRYSTLLNYM